MQAWLPVILLWFISLFTSTLAVITCIYRHLDHGKYRWKNIHKNLSPWILLAFLTAAFMVGNVWLIANSRESDVARMAKQAGLLIGLFVGLFFIICGITAIIWRKYQKRASQNRMAGQVNFNKPTGGTRNRIEQSSESAATSFEKHDEILHKIQEQNMERTISNELTSNCNQNLPPDDGILILRNLSNPREEFCLDLPPDDGILILRNLSNPREEFCLDLPPDDGILILRNLSNPREEFCIDLSDSSAPVVKRKSMISLGEFFEETILPKGEMYRIEDHGVTLDFEC